MCVTKDVTLHPVAKTIDSIASHTTVHARPGDLVAIAGQFVIHVVRTRGDLTSVRALDQAVGRQAAAFGGVGYLALLEPGADLMMDADVRKAASRMVADHTHQFFGAAMVYEKQGFAATALRSLVTAINLTSRASHPNRVFSELVPAVTWLGELAPLARPRSQELVDLISALRAELHATQTASSPPQRLQGSERADTQSGRHR